MEIKNMSLSAAQVGISVGVFVIGVPSVLVLGTLGAVAYVATKTEEVGSSAIEALYDKSQELVAKLESMKDKEVEIVDAPLGDAAIAVN